MFVDISISTNEEEINFSIFFFNLGQNAGDVARKGRAVATMSISCKEEKKTPSECRDMKRTSNRNGVSFRKLKLFLSFHNHILLLNYFLYHRLDVSASLVLGLWLGWLT